MAPRKLSDSDKSELIDLYKQPGQTTTTLAEQFGVSNSTVSRILKSSIPTEEYRQLVSQKRTASADTTGKAAKKSTGKASKTRSRSTKEASTEESDKVESPTVESPTVEPPKLKSKSDKDASKTDEDGSRRRRRRSNAKQTAKQQDEEQLPLLTETEENSESASKPEKSTPERSTPERSRPEKPKPAPPVLATAETDEEEEDEDDLLGLDEALGDDFGDDDDLDEEDDEDDAGEVEIPKPKLQAKDAMEIMPLGTAVLPKPCYLVVDTRSELITRPLAEFADLGQVPSEEETSKTLPVFDNHRVARRFSRNKQRVIKVPDGNLITRTSPYLQAKGITRLLVDGQVFDLAGID